MTPNEEFKPTLSQDEFEHLHEQCDKARKGSKFVRVEKEALECLLLDHSNLFAIAGIRD